MSFIQIAYTEDRTTSRLTTGKVLVKEECVDHLLYPTETKRTVDNEPTVLKLERIGKYKLVVHTFIYGPDPLDGKDLKIALRIGKEKQEQCAFGLWLDHEHKLNRSENIKQWIESTQYIFVHVPFESTYFYTGLNVSGKVYEMAFYIECSFLS